ncbi:MAG: carbamoyltransferase HypF [Burkholderiales bacterium]|nr:carbamoyltransferase HypF [Burkholderiales bacterium]
MNPLAHSVRLPRPAPQRVLACGAYLKNRACLLDGGQAHWSALHGDLGDPSSRQALAQSVEALLAQASGPLQAIANDLHPDFYSTQLANDVAHSLGIPAVAVQHHHAHVGAVLAEQGIGHPVIALTLDGFGLGADGNAWGGEVLWVDGADHGHVFQRVGHLAALAQPGGDAAAREPWRVAAAVLFACNRGDEIEPVFSPLVGAAAAKTVHTMLARGLNCPHSSSAGRWFDAAAGALGISVRQSHEAEAAIVLEQLAAQWLSAHPDFVFEWTSLDLHAVVAPLFALRGQGTDAQARGAAQFHLALATGLAHAAAEAASRHGTETVVLTGGCFANRVLRTAVRIQLERQTLQVVELQWVGCGDEGLALGQAWLAGWFMDKSFDILES